MPAIYKATAKAKDGPSSSSRKVQRTWQSASEETQIQFQHKSNNETYYERTLSLSLCTQDNLATLRKVFKHKFSYLLNRLAKLLNHHG